MSLSSSAVAPAVPSWALPSWASLRQSAAMSPTATTTGERATSGEEGVRSELQPTAMRVARTTTRNVGAVLLALAVVGPSTLEPPRRDEYMSMMGDVCASNISALQL